VLTLGVDAECELRVAEKKRKAVGSNPNNTHQTGEQVPWSLLCRASHPLSSLFSILFVFPSSSLQPFLLFSGISSRAISVAVVPSLHSSLSVFASYSASLLWARGSRQPNLHPRRVRRSWQLFSAAPFAIMTTASNAACIFFCFFPKPQILVFLDSLSVRSMKI
jgi:hypothetical protein